MALSEDQRALLRLLIAGDTYEQVADVLGTSPAEVRARARDAAATLERDPDPEMPAGVVAERLNALEGPPPDAVAEAPVAARPSGTERRFPAVARRWAPWLAIGSAALVVLIVIAVTGSGGDGDDDVRTSTGGQEEAVPIELTPVGRSRARGVITIIRIGDQPAVDLDISGLAPSGEGESYVLWFVGEGGRSLPVAFRGVGADGRLSGRTAIPSAAAGLLPSFDTAELNLVEQRRAAAAVKEAARSGILPEAVGEPVMRGSLRDR